MSDPVSCTELDQQHVELLPARTVLSMFAAGDGGGVGGAGTDSSGGVVVRVLGIPLGIPGTPGGAGASANG
ncbi:MAG: hypothetical protein ACRDSR_01690 [Pseudonocardiaceae bacterium]